MAESPTFRVEDLRVTVDEKEILKGVNLEVNKGEVHALMGPNGSGKSTLANTLMGHPRYKVTGGRILYKGDDITDLPVDERAKRGMFLAFQYPLEIPGVKVRQFLRMALKSVSGKDVKVSEFRKLLNEKMKQLEVHLREGMAKHGITGAAADRIVLSITSFALYGFPESHAASFALIAYASAYLKAHFPAAFYTALLNNQPMGFYHPATLVKDAQRRGVRFAPIDVQISDWDCTVTPDGAIRLGLRYVTGLREEIGRRIALTSSWRGGRSDPPNGAMSVAAPAAAALAFG